MNQDRMLKLIIWDFDGVLADTLGPGIMVWNRIAGSSYPAETTASDVRTLGLENFVRKLKIPFYKIPFYIHKVRENMEPEMGKAGTFPGIKSVLAELKQKYRLGIVTTNSGKNVEIFLEKNNMSEFFDFVVAGAGVFGKSQRITKAIRDLKVEKHEAVCIGDEVRDVRAAKQADVRIISVSWGFNCIELLEKAGAECIVESPGELLKAVKSLDRAAGIPSKSLL